MKRIRFKLFFSFSLLLILSISMVVIGYYMFRNILTYQDLVKNVEENQYKVQKAFLSQKDFVILETATEQFHEERISQNHLVAQKHIHEIRKFIRETKSFLKERSEESTSLDQLDKTLEEYLTLYKRLIEAYLASGFKDWGQIGILRKKIHQIEQSPVPYDRAKMLMLRRYEKDFLLRKDEEYVDKFQEGVIDFKDHISNFSFYNDYYISESASDELVAQIEEYEEDFLKAVALIKTIGFDAKSGIRGDINFQIDIINEHFDLFSLLIKEKSNRVTRQSALVGIIILTIQLLICLLYGYRFANILSERIKELKRHIYKLAKGRQIPDVDSKYDDELSDASKSLILLSNRIKTAAIFAKNVGEGNTDQQTYDDAKNKGILEINLVKMQSQLASARDEEEKKSWINRGMLHFSQISRNRKEDEKSYFEEVLAELVKYLKAAQGALFVVKNPEDGPPFLDLVSCYAYNRKKAKELKIEQREGIVGQVWLEKKASVLNKIPEKYLNITSGLGKTQPTSLLIVPLMMNDEVYGVVEIASFHQFEEYQVEFLKKLGESIAASIAELNINQRTAYILELTQKQAQMLQSQEEEMRQNNEELMATHEEMTRKEKAYLERIQDLEDQLKQIQIPEI